MRLLIQPGDGVGALIKGISGARHIIEIAIFRFDQSEVERALANAVSRGVSVNALIASRNRTGEENLRKLELRLLGAGVTVSRTADDLTRYHGKLMIVDRRELYLLAFNLTHHDIERSRSFGVITTRRDVVREAVKLFEADTKRIPFEPTLHNFVVSPVNARPQLAAFIQGARKDLSIYDPRVSDTAMMHLLEERAQAGVNVRIIGRMVRSIPGVTVHKLAGLRLHTRTMVRDGELVFIGSQSLRQEELEARREVGLIFRYPKITARLIRTFEDDWALAERSPQEADAGPTAKIARKVAKVVAKEMPAVAPIVNGALKEVAGDLAGIDLAQEEVEEIVKGAVRQAVKEVVREVVEEAAEKSAGRA